MMRAIVGRAFGDVLSLPALSRGCVGFRGLERGRHHLSAVGSGQSGLGMPPGWEDMLIHLIYCLVCDRLSQYKV